MDVFLKPRRTWPRRLLKWTATVIALIWFSRYAYLRITTQPADSQRLFADLAERLRPALKDDATEELSVAIANLPALPTFSEVAPAGMRWKFQFGRPRQVDLTDANAGTWDPVARPHLRAAISYLADSTTAAALDQVRGLRDRRWYFGWTFFQGALGAAGVDFGAFAQVARTFVARARFRHAELHDVEGAWDDLKSVLLLTANTPRRFSLEGLLASGTESLALWETILMLQDVDCGESLLRDMEATLAALPSLRDAWVATRRSHLTLDRCERAGFFTDDGRGNGWLVLSERDNSMIPAAGGGRPSQDRSRVWNVASALFNDRRTVEAKADRHEQRIEELVRLPYSEALVRIEQMQRDGPVFNLMDGPQLNTLYRASGLRQEFRSYQETLHCAASRGAARIVVALYRHRSVHDRFPAELAALSPEFIPELPIDPFSGQSYVFRLEPGASFVLYSWGEDGRDDGGRRPTPAQVRSSAEYREVGVDEVYSLPRLAPVWEPTTELIPGQSPEGGKAGKE